jgi:hypothetical protein
MAYADGVVIMGKDLLVLKKYIHHWSNTKIRWDLKIKRRKIL